MWGESDITQVTVRGVCSEAGVTSRYFYEQFANREAIVVAVYDEVRDHLLRMLLEVGLAEPGGIAEKVRASLTALLVSAAADPHIHRIVTSDLTSVEGLAEHRAEGLNTVTDLIVQHSPDLLGSDTPDPTDLRRGTLFIVGGINQLVEAWLADPTESPAEMAAACADLCVAVAQSVIATGRPG